MESVAIIKALIYAPSILAPYVHYRGNETIIFSGATVYIPAVPFISYNKDNLCCLVTKIDPNFGKFEGCSKLSIEPLGPRGKIGVPYIIKDGINRVVKLTPIDEVFCEYKIVPPTSIRNLDFNEIKTCITQTKLTNIRYISSDEFTNETLIAYVLNFVASELSLPPLFVKHYEGGICSSNNLSYGLNLMENCDLGSLDKIAISKGFKSYIEEYGFNIDVVQGFKRFIIVPSVKPDILYNILLQITIGLHMLQTYAGFISGDLKAGNIFLKSDKINTTYKGIKINNLFTCKIADYGKSSCMIPREDGLSIRFYNESKLADLYLLTFPFTPEIKEIRGEYYYTITDTFIGQIYAKSRHMGIPFYQSFDYYTIIVSILTNPAFYYIFFSTPSLITKFWAPLWYDEDGDIVKEKIYQYMLANKGQSIEDTITILKYLNLKCNVVNYMISRLS
jgi:hypothetical protein